MSHIKFHPSLITEIKSGDKRLTIRYNFDGKLRTGDDLKFVNSHNNQIFGNGICIDIYGLTVKGVIETEWEYHNNYANLYDFNRHFSNFYDIEFVLDDELTVIEWGDLFHPSPYYDG